MNERNVAALNDVLAAIINANQYWYRRPSTWLAEQMASHGVLATHNMPQLELLHLEHARAYGSFESDPLFLKYGMMREALKDIAAGAVPTT